MDRDDLVELDGNRPSYLWHKVSDTHVGEGGSGDHMPPTGMIPQGKRNKIQAWIDDGAMP